VPACIRYRRPTKRFNPCKGIKIGRAEWWNGYCASSHATTNMHEMKGGRSLGDVEETLQELKAHREAGRDDEALTGAWQLFDAEPDNLRAKLLVISILYDRPELATPAKKRALHGLLSDPAVDPVSIEPAACRILREAEDGFPAEEPDATAYWLENDEFTQDLLKQAYITDLDLEAALTAMRRWLLLSDRWREFPRVTEALVAQAANNEGAWPFDDEERARLDANPSELIALAFRPRRPQSWGLTDFADPVTRAVAEQYEGWPFPAWTRVTVGVPKTLAATIKKYDPDGPDTIPAQPEILIAGCGTGYEAAQIAVKYPDAKITAIDISKASLNYAAERCAAAGLKGIEFRQLDLNRVSELGRQFDAVSCCGVLHHLPDPEAAWATLSNVVKPGGVMRVMVYSKIARLMVQGWRTKIAHLLDQPVDDDS
jgi:protein-L-isoaspartate O-methyltransferase